MRATLLEILNNYLSAKTKPFAGNTLADFIRHKATLPIKAKAAIGSNYKVQGSAGQATWAEIPWICIFDSQITLSAQKGYYIVYLFRSDMSGMYLSLNMGWTQFENKFKPLRVARRNIKGTAEACKTLLRSSLSDFSYEPIDLLTTRVLGTGYELGHICGKFYSRNNIPEDNILVDDLRNLIGVYRELKGLLKKKDITNLLADWEEEEIKQRDVEDSRYQSEVERAKPQITTPGPQEKPEYTEERGRKQWKKNPGIAKACLANSNYECQVNPAHKTFTSKVTGRNYVEAHHLVPMEFQEQFQWSLDVDSNIIPLCPNCHRLLHNATHTEKVELLKVLFYKSKQDLAKQGISLSWERLIRFYNR